ncbi:MAG: hypothetical protein J07HQW2_00740 [Haloquadratum walsbyi J07HQW2]|uniref:Uncharacterized protein n=1 Tax=Haloquadratum walsbyi J07HQW2 TaxID=1238425 RepID=U1PPR5_9EURY|nr:MAG: hypothetical protein J07HQW2_00740 [Haloquadratum walsbyi J07HQW2]
MPSNITDPARTSEEVILLDNRWNGSRVVSDLARLRPRNLSLET